MGMYQSTPDFYNDYIAHRDHKYINKYKSKSGRWVYVYTQPKASDLPNPYVALNEGMNTLRTNTSNLIKRGKKAAVKGVAKGVSGVLNTNDRFNKYMNSKASATGKAVASKTSKTYSKVASKATSTYNKAAKKASEYSEAYDKYAKKRKQVAAGKKLMKKHAQNKRVQRQVESDNAVYRRALSNAYKTIKRRKSK